ncbi:hypothetical protein FRC03_005422 [Tulasnella sp. 419]|nr:hypothetical protein FRC03_005422 [Tulasnella sp. 419]
MLPFTPQPSDPQRSKPDQTSQKVVVSTSRLAAKTIDPQLGLQWDQTRKLLDLCVLDDFKYEPTFSIWQFRLRYDHRNISERFHTSLF